MFLGQIASAQTDLGLFGSLPECALVGEACPIIGARQCCGNQLNECVGDESGPGSGVVVLKNCQKNENCIPNLNGGGACGVKTESVN